MGIRYGIIGCGSMGREHIECIQALPAGLAARVTALSDPVPESLAGAHAACRESVERFADHRELLASGLCDAVVIASPNFTHAAIVDDALATDLHVLVEKPLVTRYEDGVRLVAR